MTLSKLLESKIYLTQFSLENLGLLLSHGTRILTRARSVDPKLALYIKLVRCMYVCLSVFSPNASLLPESLLEPEGSPEASSLKSCKIGNTLSNSWIYCVEKLESEVL